MSHLEDYQISEIKELFNCELIDNVIDDYDNLTEQEYAVLRFIADNPDSQYITLQNTFSMPDFLVVSLVMQYGSTSKEQQELKELKYKMKNN